MRQHFAFTALAAVGMAITGAAAAQAQTVIAREITDQPVETVVTRQPGAMVIAQEPLVTVPPATVVTAPAVAAPTETVETVRTVRSTVPLRRHSRRMARTVTTTRTIVRERVVPATAAVAAITQPTYTEVVQAPALSTTTYRARLYDVVPAAAPVPVAAPPASTPFVTTMPAYRYVYEPDRILVIDANTGIAVQAIPR
jgi:hypothetical protein